MIEQNPGGLCQVIPVVTIKPPVNQPAISFRPFLGISQKPLERKAISWYWNTIPTGETTQTIDLNAVKDRWRNAWITRNIFKTCDVCIRP